MAGGIARLAGPRASFVVGAVPKQHTVLPHSDPEAELVALGHVLRTIAILADVLWPRMLGRVVRPALREDDGAAGV